MPFFWSTPIMILTVGGRFLQHSASPKPFSFPPQLCKDPKRICSVLRSCYRDWDHLTIVTEIGITQLLLQRLGSPDYCRSDWDYLSPVTETRITWPLSQRPSAYTSQHEQSQTFVNISLFSSFFLLLPNPNYVCQIQKGKNYLCLPNFRPSKKTTWFLRNAASLSMTPNMKGNPEFLRQWIHQQSQKLLKIQADKPWDKLTSSQVSGEKQEWHWPLPSVLGEGWVPGVYPSSSG